MGDNYGWLEIVFFYGFALSFALWQYWSVSRDLKRTKEERARAEAEAADAPADTAAGTAATGAETTDQASNEKNAA
ncbi:hypothetical protein [Erythrobacter sp. MTPC3]|uniref:hypothetical protein n=1 Tax=Erythrobacter sp. MTPC3 TaxID=3056564 RepID=UPI0036F32113